jgi:hypothetical protein
MGLSTTGPITPYLNSWAYTREADDNGWHYFKCFGPKGSVDVRASSTIHAQEQAARHFKLSEKNRWRVSVVLYAKYGEAPTVHSTAAFG